jgi:glycine/D-amino acid oxidase-like deaminating enzyme
MSPRPDVVIVGDGIVGLSIAFHVVARGATVTVLGRAASAPERRAFNRAASASSGTTTNCLRVHESLRFYADAVERLQMRFDPGFRRCGYLLAHSPLRSRGSRRTSRVVRPWSGSQSSGG